MPEGHKTHFLARQHTERLAGQKLKVISPQGRFGADARKVSGKVLEAVEAFGKQMLYRFENGRFVQVHLGRYGGFKQHPSPPPTPVGQIRMRMIGTEVTIDLSGPSTCRVIDGDVREEVLAKLGPDPLAGGKKAEVRKAVRASKKPIAALLLDQSVIAGVGNIFRAEILFEAGLDPNTPGVELSDAGFDRLWRVLVKQMKTGLKYGKIVTVTAKEAGRPLAKLDGNERFRLYGHDECPRCDGPIETPEVASRRLYVCPRCQIRS